MLNQDQKDQEASETLLEDKEVQKIYRICSLQPQIKEQAELLELTAHLLQRNKDLEKERKTILEDLKREVQTGGHIVLRKFSSFGGQKFTHNNQKDELCNSSVNLRNLEEKLNKIKIEMSQKSIGQHMIDDARVESLEQ